MANVAYKRRRIIGENINVNGGRKRSYLALSAAAKPASAESAGEAAAKRNGGSVSWRMWRRQRMAAPVERRNETLKWRNGGGEMGGIGSAGSGGAQWRRWLK
jgi:hypothetical protein